MIIITAIDVPCPVCKAAPGTRCTFIRHKQYRGQLMRHGSHNLRVWGADDAQRMANLLLS